MNKQEKIELIQKLNAEVADLLHQDKMSFNFIPEWNAVKTYGSCLRENDSYTIKLSRYLVSDEDIQNTMLHELCHLYDKNAHGHAAEWQYIANIVGTHFNTEITRTSEKEVSAIALDKAVARLECQKCGYVEHIYRRTKIYKQEGRGFRCACGGDLKFIKLK